MKYSADQYFDKYDTQDIQVFSTLGLRKSDIEAIKKIDGVEQVQPLYSFDALTRIGASEQVFKVFSLPKKSGIEQSPPRRRKDADQRRRMLDRGAQRDE